MSNKAGKKGSPNEKEAPLEITPEVILQSNREVTHAVAYLRMYHYLSSLQAVTSLEVTVNGALIMPYKVLGSIGYGFTKDKKTFCLHTTGFLFELFSELKPSLADIEHGGITIKFAELKYADYILPPMLLHFPILNKKVYELASECLFAVVTKIEPSLIELDAEEVVEVLNPPIVLESKKIRDKGSLDKLSGIF